MTKLHALPASIELGRTKTIGQGHPVFVVAEAGVNHNGRADLALQLVKAAHRAGADCVKFQTFSADRVAIGSAGRAPYQVETTRSTASQQSMLKALELPSEAYPELLAACRQYGLVFLSTPYSREDADFLESLGVVAFKVASAQIVELAFLGSLARKQKPIVLSTGMATLGEIEAAVHAIRAEGNQSLVLLQCTTNYPSRVDDANLRVLDVLRESFAVQVGYSDHTESPACCVAAVALGAVVIEKHLTLDKALAGPDHQASADPEEFRELVGLVRQTELAMGSGRKEPSAAELANRPYMRRSIVARVPIRAGTVVTAEMIAFKRPGLGISPARFAEVVGSKTRVALDPDQILQWSDFER
jgi:N-acetylneuraminate synthase/N,N'-diacetyllegionaminate synthase